MWSLFFDENNNFSEYTVVSRYVAPVVVVHFHVQEPLGIIQSAIEGLPLEEWSDNSIRCNGNAVRQVSINR